MLMIRERSIVVMSKTTVDAEQQTSERRDPRCTVLLHALVRVETDAVKDVDVIDQARVNQCQRFHARTCDENPNIIRIFDVQSIDIDKVTILVAFVVVFSWLVVIFFIRLSVVHV